MYPSLGDYADDYDPASGPPTMSWDPNKFASIDEYNAIFERAAQKFRDFLVRGGIGVRLIPNDPNSGVVNAVPFGPGLPSVDVVRQAAAATMKQTGQDTIDPNAWKAIYANVPDIGSSDGGQTYYMRPTFAAPETVNERDAKALMSSLVEATQEANAKAAQERAATASTIASSEVSSSEPWIQARFPTAGQQNVKFFDTGPKTESVDSKDTPAPWEMPDETGQPVPSSYRPSTSLVRMATATAADGVQRPAMTPAVVAGIALLVLLMLPKKRR